MSASVKRAPSSLTARQRRLTPSTVVQGLWALLLSHYAGARDVVLGTTVSGRPEEIEGIEHMVGLFINALPFRVEAPPGARAWSWLQDVQNRHLDLRQYVSFFAERRVLVGRVKVATTDADDASAVPFFMLPFLGGNDTLRGFRAYRFRGPHSILLQGEYRWEIWSAFEAALFVDAGKVAMERADLNFKNLEHDYGVGFRFNTDNGVVMRVDAAFGSKDGKHLHVVFGGLF